MMIRLAAQMSTKIPQKAETLMRLIASSRRQKCSIRRRRLGLADLKNGTITSREQDQMTINVKPKTR